MVRIINFALIFSVLAVTPFTAVNAERLKMNVQAPVKDNILKEIGLLIPDYLHPVHKQEVIVDQKPATLLRFERKDGKNTGLMGEHLSVLLDESRKLKGFTDMTLKEENGSLPSETDAKTIALDFIKIHAPDLLPTIEISWIKPHDEVVHTGKGEQKQPVTLTGMKVKIRNTADGKWLWVIVGKDRKVMVFERDIVWLSFPGQRQTEKWLHDAWLLSKARTD